MRHHNANRKFGRKAPQRRALMRALALSLIDKGRITTTEAKAKELRPYIERMVTLARIDTIARRRLLSARLYNRAPETKKLFSEIAPKYKGQNGGYTRVLKLPRRKSDSSKMALIEFI